VNKDISLLLVEDGQYVEAGTEVVGYFLPKQRGGGSNAEKRHSAELVLKPGELLMVDDRGSNKSGWHVWPAWEEFYPVTRSLN